MWSLIAIVIHIGAIVNISISEANVRAELLENGRVFSSQLQLLVGSLSIQIVFVVVPILRIVRNVFSDTLQRFRIPDDTVMK